MLIVRMSNSHVVTTPAASTVMGTLPVSVPLAVFFPLHPVVPLRLSRAVGPVACATSTSHNSASSLTVTAFLWHGGFDQVPGWRTKSQVRRPQVHALPALNTSSTAAAATAAVTGTLRLLNTRAAVCCSKVTRTPPGREPSGRATDAVPAVPFAFAQPC